MTTFVSPLPRYKLMARLNHHRIMYEETTGEVFALGPDGARNGVLYLTAGKWAPAGELRKGEPDGWAPIERGDAWHTREAVRSLIKQNRLKVSINGS